MDPNRFGGKITRLNHSGRLMEGAYCEGVEALMDSLVGEVTRTPLFLAQVQAETRS